MRVSFIGGPFDDQVQEIPDSLWESGLVVPFLPDGKSVDAWLESNDSFAEGPAFIELRYEARGQGSTEMTLDARSHEEWRRIVAGVDGAIANGSD